MWNSPRALTTEWADYTGTTPVSVPGTVADSANPVGLALDIRAGATVLTDPGNHMLQSTSAARSLLSARVNLLTSTENFTDGANWGAGSTTLGSDITAGGMTLTRVVETATIANHDIYGRIALTAGIQYTLSAKFKAGERSVATIRAWAIDYGSDDSTVSYFDLVAGTAQKAVSPNVTDAGITAISDGVYLCWVTCKPTLTTPIGGPTFGMSIAVGTFSYLGDTSSGIYIGEASTTIGALTDYQYIASDSSYSSTGFPIAQLYDGVDDGMATAAFAAGTLPSGMDCMIAVRRDSAASQCIAGLYQVDGSKYFGVVSDGPGSTASTYGGCGAPTILVNGAAVADARGALYTAIGVGDWHILEYRGLDLSAWVNAGFGYYAGSYQFPGARGDILLYPSTTPTEDKDAARQWLANYYGVTLP